MLAAAVLTAAAGCGQSAASSPTTSNPALVTVAGTVQGAPGCPGPVQLDSPCPPRPLGGSVVEAMRGLTVLASATTGVDGRFSLKLPPGTYKILALAAGALRPTPSVQVTAVASPVNVTLTVDSGIR